MLAGGGDEGLAHLIHIAAVSHAHWNAKTHTWVAVGLGRDWRIDELRVGHNHGDVIVGHDHCAARANLLHLPSDARDFDPVSDCDGPFSQNYQPADEIARDILQAEANANADRAGKNRQRPEVKSG